MAKVIQNIQAKVFWGQAVTVATFGAILASFTLWQFVRPGGTAWLLWVLQCLPLLLFVPGIKARQPRTYIWLCFVLLFYFIKAVEGAFASNRAWIDFILLTLTCILFISAMLTSRWLQYQQNSPSAQANYGS